jgi:hypothetical protein
MPKAAGLVSREDSIEILTWHKQQVKLGNDLVVDTWDAFSAIGADMIAFDIYPGRGREVLCDLNNGLPLEYRNTADVVFDCITNQIACPLNGLFAGIHAAKAGGTIVTCLPMTMVNQGYYNISPSILHDVYTANRVDIVSMVGVVGVYERRAVVSVDPVVRMRDVPDDTMLLTVAVKTSDTPDELIIPSVMSKFVKTPNCKLGERHGRAED